MNKYIYVYIYIYILYIYIIYTYYIYVYYMHYIYVYIYIYQYISDEYNIYQFTPLHSCDCFYKISVAIAEMKPDT